MRLFPLLLLVLTIFIVSCTPSVDSEELINKIGNNEALVYKSETCGCCVG